MVPVLFLALLGVALPLAFWRIAVLGREGYLKQYAIDHGLNPYQPTTGGLITDSGP